jgi:hypothetical protein
VRRLSSGRLDVDVVAMTFMGKKSRALADQAAALAKPTHDKASEPLPPYVGLARDDGAGAVAAQWAALRSAFGRRDACLVFHLKNHYALVFALREWVEPPGGAEAAGLPEGQPSEGPNSGAEWASSEPTAAEGKTDGGSGIPHSSETGEAAEASDTPPGTNQPTPAPPPRRGRAVRQLLTSRRGQRPSAWLDFDEARDTMLGWEGYKLMLVERRA